ncbi:MAG: LPS assembly lipoprotein LptE [Acetobacter sp.]|uniref:LPS assembly lipoprotein LptE n=1 Tax=Acetobacter sp. TaxID=440 RepID=UPI0039EA8E09
MRPPRPALRCIRAALATLPVLALLVPLAGCGFKPLYGTQDGQADITAEMAQIYVANINERSGQQLRLALQAELEQGAAEDPHKYTLVVQPSFGGEAVDIHSDNTSGRTRITGHAHWQLFTVDINPRLLAQGDTSALDGYTGTYEQYFAQTLNAETAIGRLAHTLAHQVAQQVAIWFRTRATPASTRDRGPRAMYPAGGAISQSEKQGPMEQEGEDAVPDMATGRSTPDAGQL